jgi:DNA-binding protein YbaB
MSLDTLKLAQFAAGSAELFGPALKQVQASGESDGGKIKLTLGGDYELRDVKIAPDVVARYKVDQIAQLIMSAYTRAKSNYETEVYKVIARMAKDTGLELR